MMVYPLIRMCAGAYGVALLCAASGAVVAWAIVRSLGHNELAVVGGDDHSGNPHYDPKNPYSPPR